MIWPIMKKDWRLLWPLVVLVTAIQAGLEWALYGMGLFGEDPAAGALLRPMTTAWFVGIAALVVAVVQQDPIPGVDQDWLVRPLHRSHLLIAKLAFVAAAVCLPMLVFNVADVVATGFALGDALQAALLKELFVLVVFIVPLAALAAATRNVMELVVLGAALMVVFALTLSASALLSGPDWCPTCNSGAAWLQHLVEHAGVLLGACIVLGLMYYRRRTPAARAICLIGAALLVFVQLPWHWAFAMQGPLGGTAAAAGIHLEIDPAARATASTGAPAGTARDVNGTMQYVRRRVRHEDAPVSIEVPLRLSGAAGDELLLADRAQITLTSPAGKELYHGSTAGLPATLLTPPNQPVDGSASQPMEIPGRAFRAAQQGAQVRLDYSLTLLRPQSTFHLAALSGELRSPVVGRCATASDRNGVYLRCKIVAQGPFCFSATLLGADGRRNPEILTCKPDYRHHVPGFRDVLGFYGADLPIRDRSGTVFPLGAADLESATVEVRVYAVAAHFERVLTSSPATLDLWRAPAG